jgi:hypothetical protein
VGFYSEKVEEIKDTLYPAGWSHNFTTNNIGASLYIAFYF